MSHVYLHVTCMHDWLLKVVREAGCQFFTRWWLVFFSPQTCLIYNQYSSKLYHPCIVIYNLYFVLCLRLLHNLRHLESLTPFAPFSTVHTYTFIFLVFHITFWFLVQTYLLVVCACPVCAWDLGTIKFGKTCGHGFIKITCFQLDIQVSGLGDTNQ